MSTKVERHTAPMSSCMEPGCVESRDHDCPCQMCDARARGRHNGGIFEAQRNGWDYRGTTPQDAP